MGIAADEHPGYGYAREGQAATVEVPEPHIRVNQIAAVSNRGQVRFMTYTGTMNAALFLVFLGRFLRSTVGKVFLIVDRLKAHEDEQVAAWAERVGAQVIWSPAKGLNGAVTDGVAALAAEGIERFAKTDPDVVLLDVRLPDRSGLDAFGQLHERNAKTPIILMTGHGSATTAKPRPSGVITSAIRRRARRRPVRNRSGSNWTLAKAGKATWPTIVAAPSINSCGMRNASVYKPNARVPRARPITT